MAIMKTWIPIIDLKLKRMLIELHPKSWTEKI